MVIEKKIEIIESVPRIKLGQNKLSLMLNYSSH